MVNEEYNSLIQITCVPHLHKIHYKYCPLTQHAVSFLADLFLLLRQHHLRKHGPNSPKTAIISLSLAQIPPGEVEI